MAAGRRNSGTRPSCHHTVPTVTAAPTVAAVGSGGSAVDRVVEHLRRGEPHELRLVCIEGPGGAGKSTLAAAVADQYRVQYQSEIIVVHGDDFFGPAERRWLDGHDRQSPLLSQGYEVFAHDRLQRELLDPLRAGNRARFQRYDWAGDSLAEWLCAPPHGLVLVEGAYLLRRHLRRYWDVALFVRTPRSVRHARMHARDQNASGWIERWVAAEDAYLAAEDPAAAADLTVAGTSRLRSPPTAPR